MSFRLHISGSVLVALLFSVLLLSFALWKSPLLQPKVNDYLNTPTESKDGDILSSAQYKQDSDNDGISDWEEILLGTDPNSPNKISDEQRLLISSTQSGENSGANKTKEITQQILGAYVQSKQQGTYDKDAFNFVLAQVTGAQFDDHKSSPYTLEDITENKIGDKYGKTYKKLLNNALLPLTTIKEYELTTYGRATQTKNDEDFSTLEKNAKIYKKISSDLLKIQAPTGASQEHLNIINSFYSFAQVLEDMSASKNDPILGLVSVRNFMEEEDSIKNAYNGMDIYFTFNDKK